METMANVVTWLSDPANLLLLGVLWGGLLAAAKVIVKLTPSQADDEAVAKVAAFQFGRFADSLQALLTAKPIRDLIKKPKDPPG